MNFSLLSRLLSIVAFMIGGTMLFSLPWAHPTLGGSEHFETAGFWGLIAATAASWVVAGVLWYLGRDSSGQMYRKEAMAVVGLSWVLATLLGALPFLFSGTKRDADTVMTPADALFESQSGFSTTGATVLTDIEQPETGPALVPRCILFWRSSTHFLGGLGIIVLFVAILGQGSAGKALMRSEMPGPNKDGTQARTQHTAWIFAAIYVSLNIVLTLLLWLMGLSWFDSLCHAFGTMATGGFSTYNNSVGAFSSLDGIGANGAVAIQSTIILFMILAGTNFTLLYFLILRQPKRLLADVEWRTYALIILGATGLIVLFGVMHGDRGFDSFGYAIQHSLFQVVSILTTTGYGSEADFDQWNSFSRGLLFLLMFLGGCAGSTGGGMKIIRHILFLKILKLEIENAYHPSVVRPLRLAGEPVEDQNLRKNILVYFGMILVIFVFSWMALVTIEPDTTWKSRSAANGPLDTVQNKLIDSATGVAATLNNIGPGLGTVGAKSNYAHFTSASKLLFTFLMMLGRLEIFVILVLVMPGFWRNR